MLMLMLILMLRLIWCRSGLLCFGFGLPERIRAKAWMKVETADQKRPISVEIIIRRLKEDAGPQCSRCTPQGPNAVDAHRRAPMHTAGPQCTPQGPNAVDAHRRAPMQ